MKFMKTILAATAGLLISAQAYAADIVETAAAAGKFNTLLAAAKAAGLVEALKAPGPYTVFAPTDAAFNRLGTKTINELLLPENKDKLATILKYHVLSGEVRAADVPTRRTIVPTLAGEGANGVRVQRRKGRVTVDSARVITANIETDNGVIHVINRVLIPGNRH
jgi:uncharacterized surface protein with fasciclin (FAS1) repeats